MGSGAAWIVFVGVGILVVFFVFALIYAARYTKVGPNEALVISGGAHAMRDARTGQVRRQGYRVITGGGVFVWPVIEKAEIISLEVMTLEVKTPEVYTVTGVPVLVDGVAQIKIRNDEVSLNTAAGNFLSKTPAEIMNIAHHTLEGHLRAIIGTLNVEQIYKDREAFASKVQDISGQDFDKMGLQVLSFTIKDVRDNQGYLDALGKPRTAEVKRDAIVGQATADRDAAIKQAEMTRDATIQSSKAAQEGQAAKYSAEVNIANSKREFEMKQAEYQAQVNEKRASQDLAYDLSKYKMSQEVKAEEIRVVEVEKERQIGVQEKEILRRQKELEATVIKPAEAERQQIQVRADAQRYKLEAEAQGQAEAVKRLGIGEAESQRAQGIAAADVVKAKGLAEAEVILAKGKAEAEAMRMKAAAWRDYNEAAISQMFIERLPEIARAIAEPLSKMEKIVVISTGGADGAGAGASKITQDIVNIVAQLPPVLEGVSGINLKEMVGKIAKVGEKSSEGEGKKGR